MKEISDLLQRDAPVKWLFAGDSITHGALHTIGWRDFTEHFSERIRFELKRPRDFVIKSGISGWKITNLAVDLEWNVLQFQADVVFLKFGMNDCTLGEEGIDLYKRTYEQVISTIQQQGSRVVVQTANPVLEYAGPIRAETLPAYRAASLEVASNCGVSVIDHFERWDANETFGTLQHWLVDGFHPNEYGHRALAEGIFAALGIWDPAGSLNLPTPNPAAAGMTGGLS